MIDPVEVAKAALIEARRPDLAAQVNRSHHGWPAMRSTEDDEPVIIRAFWLAHIAVGHRAWLNDSHRIQCPDCPPGVR